MAVPLAIWGLRVAVVGNLIGADRKGDLLMEELARYPLIDTRYIRQHPNVVTPFSRILVTPDGERSRIAYWYDQTPKSELTGGTDAAGPVLSVDAYGRDERDRAADGRAQPEQDDHLGRRHLAPIPAGRAQRCHRHLQRLAADQLPRRLRV